jgi:murein DD-endopeptidase MepM/ murein hydrolase activator NlpD
LASEDYADALAEKQAERQENERLRDELQAALEYTNQAIVAANNRLIDLEARLPIAEAELATAEAALQVVIQHQREVEERLAAAEAEDARVAKQIEADNVRLVALKGIVAELARAVYRGESADATLRLILGAQTTEDFVDEYTAQQTLSRTQGNALAEMEQIAAMNRNRGARQEAVREYIAALKVLADQYVAEAEEARAVAEQKKEEIEDLLAEQAELKIYLEEQKAAYLQRQDELEAEAEILKNELIAIILAARGLGISYFDGTWSYPVEHPKVVSPFGWRIHPIFGDRRMHNGTDFRAPCGTPILAAADGFVQWAKYRNGYGNQVLINSGELNGISYMASYNHLLDDSFTVKAEDYVVRGDVIAYAGTTGTSTGCHLHFEIYVNGSPVDPMTYLPAL